MATIEKLKETRAIQRTSFTKTYNALKIEMEVTVPSVRTVEATLNVFTERAKELTLFDKELISALIDKKTSEDDITRDMNTISQEQAGKFKLPKIKLKKFNGDPREWLHFWSILKKIHEDTKLSNEEKFQYLLQSMVEGSRASEVANSYPPSSESF
ncbi:hypothetical protein TKK_0002918 [Trichogramma kaykai]